MKPTMLVLAAAFATASLHAEPSAEQISLAQKIAGKLASGEFESVRKYFDSTLKSSLSADQMEQAWNALIAQTGEFERIAKTQSRSASGFDVVEVLCATRQAGLIVRVVFDPGTERLNGLWILPAAAPPTTQESPKRTPSFP